LPPPGGPAAGLVWPAPAGRLTTAAEEVLRGGGGLEL